LATSSVNAGSRHPGRSPRTILASLLTIAMIGFLTSGCTPLADYVRNGFEVGPEYGRPPAPVADDWIDTTDKRIRKDSDDLSQWWTVFNDPVLNSLVGSAYGQNISLRQAGFQVLQARAQLGITIGELFPQTQNMDVSYTRQGLSTETVNRTALGSEKRFFGQWTYGFNLNWELDFWGRFRRSVESADDNLDASIENYDDVLVTMLSDVATNYVNVRTLQERIKLAQANVELQRRTLEIALARYNRGQGTITELDVDQAQSTLSQTESVIPQLQTQLRQANNQLCILLGIPPADLTTRIGAADIPVAPIDVAVGIPADLLRRRPDVRHAERLAAAQCAQIGVADADFYPRIALDGTFGYSAEHFTKLFVPAGFQGSFGPNFTWDFLNYGRILNNVRAQSAQFQVLVAGSQNTVLTAGAEVENGLVSFLKAQEQVTILTTSVNAAQKAANLAIVQYSNGAIDFNRLAVVEQNLVQQQDLLAQARGAIDLGLIQVYRALGGGWQIRCAGGATSAAIPAIPVKAAPAPAAAPTPAPLPAPAPVPAPAPAPEQLPPPADKGPKPGPQLGQASDGPAVRIGMLEKR
jgi:NodT family efflux transporter outer membrane factor (OMF) lipoprotein